MIFLGAPCNEISKQRLLEELADASEQTRLDVNAVFLRMQRPVYVPIDVLMLILSHISIGTIKSIPLVCKQWYACFQQPQFWDALVRKKIQSSLHLYFPQSKILHFSSQIAYCLRNYNVSLKERFSWMFLYNHFGVFFNFKPYGPIFRLHTSTRSKIEISFFDQDFHVFSHSTYKDVTKDKHNRIHCVKHYHKNRPATSDGLYLYMSESKYDNGQKQIQKIYCKTKQGHLFEGESLPHKAKPHGGGKWTFQDGSTLTGDAVAFDGVPHGKGKEGEASWFAGVVMVDSKDDGVVKKARFFE